MKIEESPFAVVETQGTIHRDVDADEHRTPAETRTAGARARHASSVGPQDARPAHPRDRIDVSEKVAMFSNAMRAARQVPAVRANLVREMRELVATGRLTHDVERLATALIDSIESLSASQMRATNAPGRYLVPSP